MVLGTEDRDGGRGLGEAVRVDELGLGEQLQRPLDDRDGHAPAAVGQMAQRGQRFPLGFEHVEDAAEHGWDDHRLRHGFVARDRDPLLGVERRQLHDAPPRVDRREDRGDPGDVVRRDAHQRRFVLICAHELDR